MRSDLVRLEGLHALKHALRFGAEVTDILTDDLDRALTTADLLAPELRPVLEKSATLVTPAQFRERAPQPIHTRVLAYARRPTWSLADGLPTSDRPTILVDDPRNSKNLGAVVRVGAATAAAGILVNGSADVCDPMAVRGAAGLQWALPCWGSPSLLEVLDAARPGIGHQLVGLDADGDSFDATSYTSPVIFAFGSERSGLSSGVRARCDQIVSLPMRPRVSSLNLATSVSAVMYLWVYAHPSALLTPR